MIEHYCKVNEEAGREILMEHTQKLINNVAMYLLDEVCSDYEYQWDNADEGDKEAFRAYAKEVINIVKGGDK